MSGKTGPGGPRGFQGPQGERGTKGRCGQEEKDGNGDYVNECKTRSLAIMIEKMVEEHNQETVANDVKAYICGFVNHNNIRDNIRNYWNVDDLKLFYNFLQNEISKIGENTKIDNLSLSNGIKQILHKTINGNSNNGFNSKIDDIYNGDTIK